MKLCWKNCPIAHKWRYHNRKGGKLATILAAVEFDHNFYICNSFFGRTGTNNDINVFVYSHLMQDILIGHYRLTTGNSYKQIGHGLTFDMIYFLAYGINPYWVIFPKPIHCPTSEQERGYLKRQEDVRKAVERFFGVLQSLFEIIRRENRRWDFDEVATLSATCVMLHNMLIKMLENGDIESVDGEDIVT